MNETIKPTYLAPDGTILIPQSSVEGAAREYGYKLFRRSLRQLAAHMLILKGEPCPLCRHQLKEDMRGRLYGTPIIPENILDEI